MKMSISLYVFTFSVSELLIEYQFYFNLVKSSQTEKVTYGLLELLLRS